MAEKGTIHPISQFPWKTVASALTITQKTGAGSLVQANETQVPHNPHGRSPRDTLDVLGKFTLNLQPNLDNLKGVGEDL